MKQDEELINPWDNWKEDDDGNLKPTSQGQDDSLEKNVREAETAGKKVWVDPYAFICNHPTLYGQMLLNQQANEFASQARNENNSTKKEIERDKQNHQEKMLDKKEEYRFARDYCDVAVYEDSDGFLRLETKIEFSAENVKTRNKKLTNYRQVYMERIVSSSDMTEKLFVIKGDFAKKIVIENIGNVPKVLYMKLIREGVVRDVAGKNTKAAISALFDYLIRHSKVIELPPHFGWYLTKKGVWDFCGELMNNIRDCMQEGG